MSPLPEPHHALLAARWQSVSTMPSTPFQSTMMNTGIVFTVLALIVYCLRMYSRIRTKQMGLGKSRASAYSLNRKYTNEYQS